MQEGNEDNVSCYLFKDIKLVQTSCNGFLLSLSWKSRSIHIRNMSFSKVDPRAICANPGVWGRDLQILRWGSWGLHEILLYTIMYRMRSEYFPKWCLFRNRFFYIKQKFRDDALNPCYVPLSSERLEPTTSPFFQPDWRLWHMLPQFITSYCYIEMFCFTSYCLYLRLVSFLSAKYCE